MRTTLRLDEDVFDLVKDYAESRSMPLGKAVSELVRRGWNTPVPTRVVNGLHVLVAPPGARPITSEDVKRMEEEED